VGLCSYEATLAQDFSRTARDNYQRVGGELRGDSTAVNLWQTNRGGGLWASGVGGPITGRGFNVGCIDDPIKNSAEADSLVKRTSQKRWYESTFSTRAEPDAAIILTMCMTGDTPVTMADGTRQPLRDVRAGDFVATYDNGTITSSIVQEWKNQGPDKILAIGMESGIMVRANERHPFLVDNGRGLEWRKVRDLKAGDRLVSAQGAAHGSAAHHAGTTGANSQQGARAFVPHTTTKPSGPADIARLLSTKNHAGRPGCITDTEWAQGSSMRSWSSRTGSAPYADSHPAPTSGRIGAGSSALTTITPLERSEGYSATTATLRSDTERPRQYPPQPLSTFAIGRETIESITPAGREDVFDVQVANTENFIANGLVSHNTRWHEDDLAGWLLTQELEEPEFWTVVSLPAIADNQGLLFPVTCDVIPDWRQPGEALCPERYDADELHKMMRTKGSRVAESLYQQRPSPDSGTIFKREWWRYWTVPDHPIPDCITVPALDYSIQSWDMSFKDTDSSDFVSGQVWGISGARVFMLDRVNERLSFSASCQAMRSISAKWPSTIGKYVEDAANGPAIINALQRDVLGIVAIKPDGGKVARAYAVQSLVQGGNVYLPHPSIAPWVEDFVRQLASFPNGAHDDDVDACTQALNQLAWTAREPEPQAREYDDNQHPGFDYEKKERRPKTRHPADPSADIYDDDLRPNLYRMPRYAVGSLWRVPRHGVIDIEEELD